MNLHRFNRQHQCATTPMVQYVWHLTHINNLNSIFALHNEILCKNRVVGSQVRYNNIAMPSVQNRRNGTLALGHSVHEYVPTFFTQKTPMLYKLKDSAQQLVLLKIDVTKLSSRCLVTANQNAASTGVKFFHGIRTDVLDWDVINATYWSGFPSGSVKRAAELLVLGGIPTSAVVGAEVANANMCLTLKRQFGLQVTLSPQSFFYH